MPLKGIPNQISPQLLKVLAAMGHGDEISKCLRLELDRLLVGENFNEVFVIIFCNTFYYLLQVLTVGLS